jgi:GH15 family glucan-1,4-alpha-glucosidase
MSKPDYCKISDYGFLSDCRSAALVSKAGSIDWLCWPRFDSPSIFARILDKDIGGHFQIEPTSDYTVTRNYVEGTNVLQTTFTTSTGSVRVNDWLHMGARQSLCRLVKCLDGEVELEIECAPRPNYAREDVMWQKRLEWLVADLASGERLVLEGMNDSAETITLREGERRAISLTWNRPGPSDIFDSRKRAIEFWRDWSEDLALPFLMPDQVKEMVKRSALVLKGLQYQPTGAFVAAPTTSLPESIGGGRNWDYRFSWLRDATFTLFALRAVGKLSEAQSWLDWLKMISLARDTTELQIMYGIDGEADLSETTLDHLSGYRDSKPVRIGNGAATQRQLDTYGELCDAIWLNRHGSRTPLGPYHWALVKSLAARTLKEWRIPDEGIWEVRGGAKDFVYSKVMCWVALDRALRLAKKDNLTDAPLEEWHKVRAEIKSEILEKGYDEEMGAFTQSYGSKSLDASNLLLAQVGFISAKDPRFVSTVRATKETLTSNGLVYRYLVSEADDGFAEEEATFAICTFWLVLALAQIGEVEEAEALYSHTLQYANDLGLYAEELTSDGEHLGNFPQAFTHIALISCAFALDHLRTRKITD